MIKAMESSSNLQDGSPFRALGVRGCSVVRRVTEMIGACKTSRRPTHMNTMLIARRTVMMMMMMMMMTVMVAKLMVMVMRCSGTQCSPVQDAQWQNAALISNKTNSILAQLHDLDLLRSFRQPQHIAEEWLETNTTRG